MEEDPHRRRIAEASAGSTIRPVDPRTGYPVVPYPARVTTRRAGLFGLLTLAAGVGLLWARVPAPLVLAPVEGQPRLWRGAYHVHTTRSDGSGTPEAVAAAAARAGLDFVILSDHGDATRPPDPPRLVDGVLVIDAVEISADDGHYVALDLPQAPYPLAGEGRAVADDVRRLGGLGILAHPDSPRPALAWHDPSVDADGFEWVNADSTWRSAPATALLRRLLAYPLDGPGALTALALAPAALMAERDQPSRPPQLALAAVDAHARIGWTRDADPMEGGRSLAAFPSYATSFGTFGLVVPWLDGAPTGDAARDARVVLDAIRHRVAYAAVFGLASPTWLSLELLEPQDGLPGPDARGKARLSVRHNGPPGSVVRLLRNGRPWRELPAVDAPLPLADDEAPAIYRAELWRTAPGGGSGLPLALSPARGHNLPTAPLAPPDDQGATGDGVAMALTGWHGEHDPASRVDVDTTDGTVVVKAGLRLAPGARRSQFAALVGDLAAPPPSTAALELDVAASGPMRLSVQVREPRPGEGLRWRHSAFVDQARRRVRLPLDEFTPIRPATGPPPLDRLHALLLVMDTVNARPGEGRTITVHAARWTRDR